MNSLLPTNNIQSPQIDPPKNVSFLRHHLISEIIALLIILAGIGIFYYYRAMNPKVDTSVPIQHVAKDDTADWQTYTNAEYDLEFEYPKSWEQFSGQDMSGSNLNLTVVLGDPRGQENGDPGKSLPASILIGQYQKESDIPPLAAFIQAQPGEAEKSEKTVVIAGQTVTEEDYKTPAVEGAHDITYEIKIPNSGHVYLLQFEYILAGCLSPNPEYETSCDQDNQQLIKDSDSAWNHILSTFKFSDSATSVDTSPPAGGWKTYTNTQYGFEFKYPGDWKIGASQTPNSFFAITKEYVKITNRNPEDDTGICSFGYNFVSRKENEDLRDWNTRMDKETGSPSPQSVKDVTLDNKEGIEVVSGEIGTYHSIYLPQSSTTILAITYSCGLQADQGFREINQILSTFKFTK